MMNLSYRNPLIFVMSTGISLPDEYDEYNKKTNKPHFFGYFKSIAADRLQFRQH